MSTYQNKARKSKGIVFGIGIIVFAIIVFVVALNSNDQFTKNYFFFGAFGAGALGIGILLAVTLSKPVLTLSQEEISLDGVVPSSGNWHLRWEDIGEVKILTRPQGRWQEIKGGKKFLPAGVFLIASSKTDPNKSLMEPLQLDYYGDLNSIKQDIARWSRLEVLEITEGY